MKVLTSTDIQMCVCVCISVSRLLHFHIWKGEHSACTVLCRSSSFIVVLTDITSDVYNYRLLKSF